MRILIPYPPEKLEITFETKGPPCSSCAFRQAPRDYDEVAACMRANPPQSIIGSLLKECREKKWYKEGGPS